MKMTTLPLRSVVPLLGLGLVFVAERASAGVIFGFDSKLRFEVSLNGTTWTYGGGSEDGSATKGSTSENRRSTSAWWQAFSDWFQPTGSGPDGADSPSGDSFASGSSAWQGPSSSGSWRDGGWRGGPQNGSGSGSGGPAGSSGNSGGNSGAPPYRGSDVGPVPVDWLDDSSHSGAPGGGGTGGATTPPVVPEPSSAALLGLGLAGWYLRQRRRRAV